MEKSLHTYKIRRFLSQGNIGQVFLTAFLNSSLLPMVCMWGGNKIFTTLVGGKRQMLLFSIKKIAAFCCYKLHNILFNKIDVDFTRGLWCRVTYIEKSEHPAHE